MNITFLPKKIMKSQTYDGCVCHKLKNVQNKKAIQLWCISDINECDNMIIMDIHFMTQWQEKQKQN